jgi:hypothetical protein
VAIILEKFFADMCAVNAATVRETCLHQGVRVAVRMVFVLVAGIFFNTMLICMLAVSAETYFALVIHKVRDLVRSQPLKVTDFVFTVDAIVCHGLNMAKSVVLEFLASFFAFGD